MGVVVDDHHCLLVLNHSCPRKLSWGLHSGRLKPSEWTQAALFPEVGEETRLLVDGGPLLFAGSALTRNRLDIAYPCRLRGGTPRLKHEILEMRFCDIDALPEDRCPAQRSMGQLARGRYPDWFGDGIAE